MILSNTESLPGFVVTETLGVVDGACVRAKNVVTDIKATVKNMMGGEIPSYTNLMHEARSQALERLMEKAEAMGADAVVNIRYTSVGITVGVAEVMVYGTAVKLSKSN